MSGTITYDAPPTLARFMRSDTRVRACIGPIGSGKSSAAVLEIIRRAAQQAPDEKNVRATRFAVIRNTYRELEDTTRKTFEQWIPPETGHWNENDFQFDIDRPLGDGTRMRCEVLFRALDKPGDVKKVLSLELTGAYINEMREIPKAILDGLRGRVGRFPAMKDGGPSWYGVWGDSNPWPTGHWGYRLFSVERPAGFELFEQPDALGPDAENLENLVPGYYAEQVSGKDAAWIDEYLRAKYPDSAQGSVYGKLLAALEQRGGISEFEHATTDIFTTWDLGYSDSTSIWFWRFRTDPDAIQFAQPRALAGLLREVEIVDHYSNHGQPLSHYFALLDHWAAEKGYRYRKHFLPHDARARTLVTGSSVLDQFIEKVGAGLVEIVPELSLEDGIAAGRWLLEQAIRIHTRCAEGVEALRQYRYKYDENTKTFSRTPVHDWASHDADGFRYLAIVVKLVERITRPVPQPETVRPQPLTGGIRLPDILSLPPRRKSGRI